jgi:hypothetical protein
MRDAVICEPLLILTALGRRIVDPRVGNVFRRRFCGVSIMW